MYKHNKKIHIYIYVCVHMFFHFKKAHIFGSSEISCDSSRSQICWQEWGGSNGKESTHTTKTYTNSYMYLTCIFIYIYTLPETNSEFTHEDSNLCWKMIHFQIRGRECSLGHRWQGQILEMKIPWIFPLVKYWFYFVNKPLRQFT